MANFHEEFQNPKPSFSLINNSNMELLNNMGGFESFLDHHQQPQLPPMNNFADHINLPNSYHSHDGSFYDPITHFLPSAEGPSHEGKQANIISQTSNPGSELADDNRNKKNYLSFGGKKRKRSNEREVEKPREVVHVRAKRGQATDSHSLAERLRREKINEKLRSLQDLVPGCYKTMGMAVMLDVITNYVRSLQNQIEFLSMKLSAASLFYDFNAEMDAMETMQGTNGYETQGMERMGGEGYGGGGGSGGFSSYFPSTWPSLT